MSRLTQIAIALIFAFFYSLSAHSAGLEDRQGWAGGLFGISVPNADNTSSRMMYGINAGAKLGSELGLSGYFFSANKDEDTFAFDYQLFGVQLSYHFEGEAAGAFFGGRVGISKVKRGIYETSPTHYGIVGGYDHALNENISIGGEASYMGMTSGSDMGVTIASFGTLNFLASLKFWF